MSTVPIPQGATIEDPTTQQTPQPTAGSIAIPQGASIDSDQSGEITNDVGNTVIVPKNPGEDNEESFSDTIARAIHKQRLMTPEEQKQAIAKEENPKDLAVKGAETLGATAGAAALPFVGSEALVGVHMALSAGFKALVPAMAGGAAKIGEWAEAHPVARAVLMDLLKRAARGTAIGVGAALGAKAIRASGE